ncbi:uncharacterized protein LOC144475372 [Augochlora pura]
MAHKRGGNSKKDDTNKKNQTIFGEGKFTFPNNDRYKGEYKGHTGQFAIVKQGKGVYTTDNFDVYDGEWNNDAFNDGEIHIRYNNKAEYRGNIDSNGTMNGWGTYMFPDGSSLEAIWFSNIPLADIIYREPLGYKWILEELSSQMITLSSGNHFWDDMMLYLNTTDSTETG